MKKLSIALVAAAALSLAACNKPAATDNVSFENETTLNADGADLGGNLAIDDTDALTNDAGNDTAALNTTGDALTVNETATTTTNTSN